MLARLASKRLNAALTFLQLNSTEFQMSVKVQEVPIRPGHHLPTPQAAMQGDSLLRVAVPAVLQLGRSHVDCCQTLQHAHLMLAGCLH